MVDAVAALQLNPADISALDQTGGAAPLARAEAPGFSETMRAAFNTAIETVANAESSAIAGARGEASLHDTVHAVINAELTVQAVASIRDKAVQAYQDLIRMPI